MTNALQHIRGFCFGYPLFCGYEVLSRQPDQLHLRIDGVRTTFLAYPFRFRYPALEFQRVRVADPRDIAVMKAQAIGRRATARDYVDLALLLDMRVTSINEIITAAKEIFVAEGEAEFSERLFLQQLVYTEDIQDAAEAVALVRIPDWTFERAKRVLEKEVQNYLQKTMDPETRGFKL
ncbi:MAG: nucleotidyl transferase AbiEii/AbiGii toxin family protein [Clostridiales bacterium]|nr:nucleotidyl transferase AbiEii/AbiGii toxin family protein [Clostridiales bacterium]